MHNFKNQKFFKFILLIITLFICYLIISVYYPKQFFSNSIFKEKIELTNFSLINPKYITYDFDKFSNSNDLKIIELKRNWKLGWDQYNLSEKLIVTQDNLKNFKTEVSNSKRENFVEIIKNTVFATPNKYEIKETDTYEETQYKQSFTAPARVNSIHKDLSAFKKLRQGMVYNDFNSYIDSGDIGTAPDQFHPDYFKVEFNISSNKVLFAFLTFKEGYPNLSEEAASTVKLVDIGFVTQKQEKVIVPVNSDRTYNWEAVKDKID
jgi:competence protein ComGC